MLKKTFLTLFLLFLLYVVGVLLYATWHDYQPEEKITVLPNNNSPIQEIEKDTLDLLTWNIGYGGLGAESDFFYADGRILFSGGMMIRPSETLVRKNTDGTLKTIKDHPADIILLQEVDLSLIHI